MTAGEKITSQDVAESAGVSQSTVSRVLNGNSRVASETREKVLEVVERLGYTPNALARGLVTSRSGLVGVIASNVTNPFYPQFLESIGQRLVASNLSMLLWNSDERGNDILLESLLAQRLDGVLFTSAMRDSELVKRIQDREIPVVLTNRYVDDIECDVALGDNESGARDVARYLVELGHERIGVISGDAMTTTSRDRLKGFLAELKSLGVEVPDELVLSADFHYSKAYAAAQHLLGLNPRPTAIFGLSDHMALAALNAARSQNVSVPDELSVVGFDDILMAGWETFELTTVHQPFAEMAQASVDMLVERFNDPTRSSRKLVFPSRLVIRETTAPKSGQTREEKHG